MPKPVLAVSRVIAALIAALLMGGLGMGVAAADPDDSGTPTDPGTDTPSSSEPEPTTGIPPTATPAVRPPSIFDIPQTIATQLRDMFGKPLSIFGNGRVPGTLTTPDVPVGGASPGRKRDRPSTGEVEAKPDVPAPEVVSPEPARRGSTVEVALPFTPPIAVPVPSIPVPGYESVRWSLNLTDPYAAYTSVGQTLNTVNSLLMDAYAPYDPFRPPAPPPTPSPTFRTLQEEPSVVDVDGTGGVVPLSTGSSGLPVLQAPVVVPQIRVATPRPISGSPPAGPRVLAAGSAGVRAPAVQGSVAQTGSIPTDRLPPAGSAQAGPASAMGAAAPRQGYPRYLRMARANEMAMVAVPGLAGLVALTFSGGVIGYRQANSGRYLRTGAARFLT
ncbi:hypothetical protein [Mycobacterium sp. NPDC006124]|uniref:hypothetical protein n=1 Tax=Mycobacterium sp. NPDC006124 TaxID=3156729 RepID=UPI0033A3318F